MEVLAIVFIIVLFKQPLSTVVNSIATVLKDSLK
jgi:hypothetical protein